MNVHKQLNKHSTKLLKREQAAMNKSSLCGTCLFIKKRVLIARGFIPHYAYMLYTTLSLRKVFPAVVNVNSNLPEKKSENDLN